MLIVVLRCGEDGEDCIDGEIVTIFRRSESTKYVDNSRFFVDS